MKFPINTAIKINDCEWIVAEYRLGRGREWVYTLSTNGRVDGSSETMRLNETAIKQIISSGKTHSVAFENTKEVFAI